MSFTAFDHAMMARALVLAEKGRAITTPNPFVGAVIVKDGRIVGEGFTQAGGRPHAEAEALAAAGGQARGATVYSTLEPCALHAKSRGPACSDLLIEAGVARVVSALHDPFDGVNGAGHDNLLRAGIAVECGLMEALVKAQLRAFLSRVTRGRPWVTLKIATTQDGKTALANGQSKWITGEDARRDVHRLRRDACAILTGIGTVQADDPALTVRDVPCTRQPLRILLDSRLDVEDAAAILQGGNTLIATSAQPSARMEALRARGVDILQLPTEPVKGKVDLAALFQALGQRGINHVMVETGARLNASLLSAGVVDELVTYVAPAIVGDSARGAFDLPELTTLEGRTRLNLTDVRHVGRDLRLTALIQKD